MSYKARVSRERNPHANEEPKEKPFFSKKNTGKNPVATNAFFQPKLSVNKPGDGYEQEADRVADAVVNKTPVARGVNQKQIHSVQRLSTPTGEEQPGTNDARMERDKEKPVIQKMDDPIKEKEKKKVAATVQKKNETAGPPASPQVSSKIESSAGRGQSMPQKTLREMNDSFGADFGGVRIHKDSEATSLNKELHAQAFTHGRDIYFNEGKFDPASQAGKLLLAHELTHVVQQGGANEKIQRDLAIEPSNPLAEQPVLTPRQIQDAIFFNNERYNESSIRLIQDIVGAGVTGTDPGDVLGIADEDIQRNAGVDRSVAAQDQIHIPAQSRPRARGFGPG